MDKRNLLKIGGIGLAAATVSILSTKTASANDNNWAEELVNTAGTFFLVNHELGVHPEPVKISYLVIHKRMSGIYEISHKSYILGEMENTKTPQEGDEENFDTLKEAYAYAKELKAKHYS